MTKPKILIADDDISIRNMLSRYFETSGFEVILASNGLEAIDIEKETKPDLVILDVEMPEMNGLESCRMIREKRSGINYIPIIFLSGASEESSIIKGLELGADDYICKPFEPLELLTRINNLLKMKNLIGQLESLENMVFALVKSIEARDSYTATHSHHVSIISKNIGKKLGLSEKEIEILKKGSLLHDVGKIGISDQILNKKDKLTLEEFAQIKRHPVLGQEICSYLKLDPNVHAIIHHHHEKLNGSGYPDRLKGDEINKLVRIVTVADMFDALTTNRPYRLAKSNSETISILEKETEEGKLDTSIVDCIKVICK
ncbi:MAG: HD domain-containing phosphohydrolase [Candidatus Firestonebacteria bacterium]